MSILKKIGGVIAAGCLVAAAMAIPAEAASSSGRLDCVGLNMPYLTTYTSSNLQHTHTYTPDAGAPVNRVRYTTQFATMSPFQKTRWSATNASPESWRLSPRAVCLQAPQ